VNDEAAGHAFRNSKDYRYARERLGALILLPRTINQKLGDKTYADKRAIYAAQADNALARSVLGSELVSPNLRKTLEAHGVVFADLREINKASLAQRQKTMVTLADYVWSGERLADLLKRPGFTK
jgi:hypothetical protein